MNYIKFIVVFLTFICNLNGQNTIFESNYSGVRVRSLPNLDSEVLYNLRKGKDVILLNEKSSNTSIVTLGGVEQTGYWQKVQVENTDIIGWVHEAALVPKANNSTSYKNTNRPEKTTTLKTKSEPSQKEEKKLTLTDYVGLGIVIVIILWYLNNRGGGDEEYIGVFKRRR